MLTAARSHSWIVKCRQTSGIRLLCFPYAGGGPSVFRGWPQYLSTDIELCAVQLPGRESRMKEAPIGELRRVVVELAEALAPSLDRPVALFGHSIGGLIAFELAREMRRRFAIEPVHLFVSGCSAPQIYDNDPLFDLPEDEFLDRMRRFNGTPREVLEHPEMMQLVLPALRADFSLRDTYRYVAEPPLRCAISVFGGTEDVGVGKERLEPWKAQTSKWFQLCLFQGDHFFLRTAQAAVVESVSTTLQRHGK
ncbi:MAG: alpha/beta fold hydrolase [Nitrospirales bacterium]|nr:alpha/beta fold hydrolase [Nitrospirales bacterium]